MGYDAIHPIEVITIINIMKSLWYIAYNYKPEKFKSKLRFWFLAAFLSINPVYLRNVD